MGQKIYKKDLLNEIQQKIKTCITYQSQNPDPSAKSRVDLLDKNPCNDGKYYAVVTLKNPLNIVSTKKEDLIKYKELLGITLTEEISQKLFQCGCIIWYNLKNNTINVKKYDASALNELFSTLIWNYFGRRNKRIKN